MSEVNTKIGTLGFDPQDISRFICDFDYNDDKYNVTGKFIPQTPQEVWTHTITDVEIRYADNGRICDTKSIKESFLRSLHIWAEGSLMSRLRQVQADLDGGKATNLQYFNRKPLT